MHDMQASARKSCQARLARYVEKSCRMTLRDMRDFSYDERMTTPVREHQVSEPPSLATFGARLAIIRWSRPRSGMSYGRMMRCGVR